MTDAPVVLSRTTDVLSLTVRGAALVALLPMLALTAWIWAGFSRPSPVLVLEGFQMYLLAPAWFILVGSFATRHWILAALAGVVAVSHLCFCIPAATADRVPAWAPKAPTMTMFVANVRYDNDDKAAVAKQVLDADADVVILNETTPAQRAQLEAIGLYDRYPTRMYHEGSPFGEMIMTRLPATDVRVENLGGARVPSATVTVGRQEVRIFATHVHAPKSSAQRHVWRRNLDGIGRSVEARGDLPEVYVGDFNSAPWHGPYRDLLDRGLTDAHDALGQGLSRSWTPEWPALSWLGPVMRLDHALYTPGVAPRKLRDVTVPGSDHRGFELTVAIEQPAG